MNFCKHVNNFYFSIKSILNINNLAENSIFMQFWIGEYPFLEAVYGHFCKLVILIQV